MAIDPHARTRPALHPLMAIAAIAVTALSITGIAVMTGHLGGADAHAPALSQAAPPPHEAATSPQTALAPPQPAATSPQPAATPPAVRAAEPRHGASPRATSEPAMATVMSIQRVNISEPNNGVGAVAGGVLGGVTGHQFGDGRGNDVATVLGAVGGALAGNAIEKNRREAFRYDVRVRTAAGAERTLHYVSAPPFAVGDRISLRDAPQG